MNENQNLKVKALLFIIKGLLSVIDKKNNTHFYVVEAKKILLSENMLKQQDFVSDNRIFFA